MVSTNQPENTPLKRIPRHFLFGIYFDRTFEYCQLLILNRKVICFLSQRFSVDSKLNVFKKSFGGGNMPGAGHGDDQCYIFR